MTKTLAWAVLCKNGDVHEGYLFLADDQARDEREILEEYGDDYDCGPHRVVALQGEEE